MRQSLEKLDDRVASHKGLVDERFATADSGVFAYVSTAEGRYDMDRFPYIRNWLARVKARPG